MNFASFNSFLTQITANESNESPTMIMHPDVWRALRTLNFAHITRFMNKKRKKRALWNKRNK